MCMSRHLINAPSLEMLLGYVNVYRCKILTYVIVILKVIVIISVYVFYAYGYCMLGVLLV